MAALQLQTKETLELFVEKAQELFSSSFVEHMLATGGQLKVSFRTGENLEVHWAPPEAESVRAFVLTFRFFIQNNEAISLGSLQRVLDDPGISPQWANEYTRIRAELNQFLDAAAEPLHIVWNNHEHTRREVMEIFVFGGLAHANRDKRQIFEEWKKSDFFTLFQYEFSNTLMNILSAIRYLAHLSEQELN